MSDYEEGVRYAQEVGWLDVTNGRLMLSEAGVSAAEEIVRQEDWTFCPA